MQGPLRVVLVEHRQADYGIAAQMLAACHLEFNWKCAASPRELSRFAADFRPHIVLCTDDMSANSNRGLLGALRLLCSQPPVILISSVRDHNSAAAYQGTAPSFKGKRQAPRGRRDRPRGDSRSPRIAQDAAELRKRFAAVLESSTEPAVISDADGWITHANTRACRLHDGSSERSLVTVLNAASDQCPEMPHWLADLDDDDPLGDQCSEIGVAAAGGTTSARRPLRLAYLDSWSLFPTSVHMDDLIGCVTARKREYRAALAVIAVDRDSGRIPDEACNPAMGNELSVYDSHDMPHGVSRYGSIVRISPIDFLVVLPDPSRPSEAAITVQRLLEAIRQRRLLVAPAHRMARTAEIDAFSKDSGSRDRQPDRSNTATGDSKMQPPERERLGVELGDAIQRHALSVHYQPQFDLKTGRGCGVEALARWVLYSGESIAPSVFIPVAERAGIIHTLGAWMLQSACETAHPWCGRDAQQTTLSVNVSALQIDEKFCQVIASTLAKYHFPAKQLELEITEGALIANPELTIGYLKKWKELGVRIAMDDFGTGYSSLSYLSRLPVDCLKLDQSLIHRMTLDTKTAAVTRLIVALGAELGIDVIAEGVEAEEQLHMLTDMNCPRVQGYLLARPMPAKQAQIALRKAWGNRPTKAMEAFYA